MFYRQLLELIKLIHPVCIGVSCVRHLNFNGEMCLSGILLRCLALVDMFTAELVGP